MLRAWKIGRFFDIDLYIHWSFLLLPLWVIISKGENEIISTPLLLTIILSIFGCVILHEYGHALMARRFGIVTRDITLYPIGGVARLERISDQPWDEFWIAVAGPAVNVVILILLTCFGISLLLVRPELLRTVTDGMVAPTTFGIYLLYVAVGNLGLVLFNMVPAFPMDGGRVFRAILSMWVGQLQATRIAARVGMFIAIVGGAWLAIVTANPWVLAVAFFVLIAGQQELRYVEWKHSQAAHEDEPIPMVPVYQNGQPARPNAAASQVFVPLNGLLFQPRVSVFIWDNENGAWVKEAGRTPPPRFNEG